MTVITAKKLVGGAAATAALSAGALVATSSPAGAAWAETTEENAYCHLTAGIERLSGSTYRIRGEGGCVGEAELRIWCFPVHRHSTYWHSHTDRQVQQGTFGKTVSASSGTITGGENDTYKTNCKLEVNGSVQLTAESPSVNL